jgi:hypothetical protein
MSFLYPRKSRAGARRGISLGAACAAVALFTSGGFGQAAPDRLLTFTDPDQAFSFRYSPDLIECVHKGVKIDAPAENCSAYFPVCGGEMNDDATVIACLAYPKNKYTDTGVFEAATFSIEILSKIKGKSACLSELPDTDFKQKKPATSDHGVSFRVFEGGEGGMNQSGDWLVYRTFHLGTCYQLEFDSAMANSGVFDPPAAEITKEGWNDITQKLEQPRKSFCLLKRGYEKKPRPGAAVRSVEKLTLKF